MSRDQLAGEYSRPLPWSSSSFDEGGSSGRLYIPGGDECPLRCYGE